MERAIRKACKNINNSLRKSSPAQAYTHNISKFHKATDDLVAIRLSEEPDLKFDCKNGCTNCCNLRVEALPPEVFRVARNISERNEGEQKRLVEKLEKAAEYAKGKSSSTYDNPCPFLSSNGSCEIYSVRPHKCRKYYSMSLEHCLETRSALEESQLVEAENSLAMEVMQTYTKKGTAMSPTEMSQAVLDAIRDHTLEAKWASGDLVFDLLPEQVKI